MSIALTNIIVGIVIGIVLMEIAFIVIGLNAKAYVKGVLEKSSITQDNPTIKFNLA